MLKIHSDWLVKIQLSFAVSFQGTQGKMAFWFASMTSEEVIQIDFLWHHCLTVYSKTTIHLLVGGQRWIFTSQLRSSVYIQY